MRSLTSRMRGGTAESHAVAMASGIAKAGGRAVFGLSSSFLQRACDQLAQDLALNQSPAVSPRM